MHAGRGSVSLEVSHFCASVRLGHLFGWSASCLPDNVSVAGNGRSSVEAWYDSLRCWCVSGWGRRCSLLTISIPFDTVHRSVLVSVSSCLCVHKWFCRCCDGKEGSAASSWFGRVSSTMRLFACGSSWPLVFVSLGIGMVASLTQRCPLSILLCGIGSCSISINAAHWPRAMPRLSEACTTASTSGSEVREANIRSRLFAVPPLGLAQFRAGVRRQRLARLSQTSHFATLLNRESRRVH